MIKVNNRDSEWVAGLTITKLLEQKKYTFSKIIVSVNEEVIPAEKYDTVMINDGDDVKVIHLLAGG